MLIMTLDDEKLCLDTLTDAVRQAVPQAEVRAYSNAYHALDDIRRNNLRPEMVFTDIEMPGMSGIELAQQLKDDMPDVNIVFVTGFRQYALEAIDMHCSGYVLKPVMAKKVLAELPHLRVPAAR